MSKESFIYWLENNRNIVSYSVNRYANAIDTISSELENYGLDRINLYNITDTAIIDIILANPDFQQKNKKGNRMYSASLNHFKKFIEYGNDK
jgi:5-methylcytosine-specific restriction enzyme A